MFNSKWYLSNISSDISTGAPFSDTIIGVLLQPTKNSVLSPAN